MKQLSPPKNPLFRTVYLLVRRFLRHNVGAQSAALAFYLLFMLFPFLIFISALLGLLQLDVAGILRVLSELLPTEVVDFAEVYLTYVGANPSPRLLMFGLVFSIYFPMRATNALMRAVRKCVGFEALVDTKCRAYEELYMAYITPDAREEKLLEHPELFNTPIVRNGREATVGYCPEVWSRWE